MAKKAITHVNLVDEGGQVFCFKEGDIVTFDGPFVATTCWQCPVWTGLAGGYGVECKYADANLGDAVEKMTYRNSEDARDHAPDTPGDLKSVADKDAIKMNEMRAKLLPDQTAVADEVKQDKQDAANKDQETADAAAADTVLPEGSATDISAVAPVIPDAGVTGTPGTLQMKKARVIDMFDIIQKTALAGPKRG
jgi:hypothetical protein